MEGDLMIIVERAFHKEGKVNAKPLWWWAGVNN